MKIELHLDMELLGCLTINSLKITRMYIDRHTNIAVFWVYVAEINAHDIFKFINLYIYQLSLELMRDQLKETALIRSLPKEIYFIFLLVQIHNRRKACGKSSVGWHLLHLWSSQKIYAAKYVFVRVNTHSTIYDNFIM